MVMWIRKNKINIIEQYSRHNIIDFEKVDSEI